MLLTSKFKDLKKNIFFVTNLVIVSNLVNYLLSGEELYNREWLYSSFGILITYIFYLFFISDFIKIDDKNYLRKRMKLDSIRYFFIFTFSHFISNYMIHGSIELSILWFVQTVITVFLYVIFDYIFSDFVLNLNNYKILYIDIVKILFAEILAILVTFQSLELIDLSQLIAYVVSYIVWSLVVKKII